MKIPKIIEYEAAVGQSFGIDNAVDPGHGFDTEARRI